MNEDKLVQILIDSQKETSTLLEALILQGADKKSSSVIEALILQNKNNNKELIQSFTDSLNKIFDQLKSNSEVETDEEIDLSDLEKVISENNKILKEELLSKSGVDTAKIENFINKNSEEIKDSLKEVKKKCLESLGSNNDNFKLLENQGKETNNHLALIKTSGEVTFEKISNVFDEIKNIKKETLKINEVLDLYKKLPDFIKKTIDSEFSDRYSRISTGPSYTEKGNPSDFIDNQTDYIYYGNNNPVVTRYNKNTNKREIGHGKWENRLGLSYS